MNSCCKQELNKMDKSFSTKAMLAVNQNCSALVSSQVNWFAFYSMKRQLLKLLSNFHRVHKVKKVLLQWLLNRKRYIIVHLVHLLHRNEHVIVRNDFYKNKLD